MLGEQILFTDGNKIVSEAVSVVAGRCVILDTSNEGKVKYPTSSNMREFAGVVQEKEVLVNRAVTLAIFGDIKCIAAAAITIGDEVYMYGTAGKVAKVPLAVTPETCYWSIGIALETVTTDGDQVLIRLHGNTKQVDTV